MFFNISFTDTEGNEQRIQQTWESSRKARNFAKWMATRKCFTNIKVWHGHPGEMLIATF